MSCLEAIRNGAKQRAMDALQREVTRHALTNRERCMTEEESARLLR
jgi:hypothetical protein